MERMQQVVPFLWIGDINAAHNDAALRTKGIRSVLTAMQGELAVHPVRLIAAFVHITYLTIRCGQTFLRHTVPINDQDDVDVLTYLTPAIAFIQAEIDKGYGVLVHCIAGISGYSP
jgi:dual specificity phosphatase 12